MAFSAQNNDMSTRRENRETSPILGQIRRGGGIMQPVTIRDMSSRGLQGTCFNAPAVGEQVVIRFESEKSVHGIVRWSRKGVFGLEFRAPVNVAMVTEKAKTHPLRRSTDAQ